MDPNTAASATPWHDSRDSAFKLKLENAESAPSQSGGSPGDDRDCHGFSNPAAVGHGDVYQKSCCDHYSDSLSSAAANLNNLKKTWKAESEMPTVTAVRRRQPPRLSARQGSCAHRLRPSQYHDDHDDAYVMSVTSVTVLRLAALTRTRTPTGPGPDSACKCIHIVRIALVIPYI